MKLGFLKNIIGAVAPTLGSALAGPMGGMAGDVVAKVLGCENTPKALEKAVQSATPEQMLELKKAEKEFEVQMAELEVTASRAKQRSLDKLSLGIPWWFSKCGYIFLFWSQ